jgi:hypothetical protein
VLIGSLQWFIMCVFRERSQLLADSLTAIIFAEIMSEVQADVVEALQASDSQVASPSPPPTAASTAPEAADEPSTPAPAESDPASELTAAFDALDGVEDVGIDELLAPEPRPPSHSPHRRASPSPRKTAWTEIERDDPKYEGTFKPDLISSPAIRQRVRSSG